MLPRPRGIIASLTRRVGWLVGILLLLLPVELLAEPNRNNIVCRDDLSSAHRDQLAVKLRKITGFPDLKFDRNGILRQGSREPVGGSRSARELLNRAIYGSNVVVIEDASERSDVAFCREIPGRWKENALGSPPVFVVQIDFSDFEQLIGDARALESFDVAWGFLHELDHIVNDTPDASSLGETGECEAHINQMRLECNLPQRADYFYTLLPLSSDTAFMTRLVRLAFEQQQAAPNKNKRYWLVWDANVVGGLKENQIAALR